MKVGRKDRRRTFTLTAELRSEEGRKEGRKDGRTDEGRKEGQMKEGRKEGRTEEGPGRTTQRLKSLYLLVHVVCLRVKMTQND